MFKPDNSHPNSYLQQNPFYLYDPTLEIVNPTFSYPRPFQNAISHPNKIPLGIEQGFVRQLAPFQHGPERLEERPPHTQHVDWASMFPNEIYMDRQIEG